jgi:hypothetical protein
LSEFPFTVNSSRLDDRSFTLFRYGVGAKFDLTVAVDPVLASKALRLPARLRDLLVPGGGWTTLLLWVVFAINLGAVYATQSWLPTLLTERGYAGSVVVTATALTSAGGVAIVPLVGRAMDRLGAFRSLATLYLVGFLFVGARDRSPGWNSRAATLRGRL